MKKTKRTVADIQRFCPPKEILDLVSNPGRQWPYKERPNYYHTRDQGLIALTFLLSARIHETLRIKREQFDFNTEADLILIRDFEVGKRKKKTIQQFGRVLKDLPIPKHPRAELYPFTQLILAHYRQLDRESLFMIGRKRAWQIFNHITGKWCHWFRSMALSYYVNKIRNPLAISRMFGVKNPQTLLHYYRGTWQEYREEFRR